MPAGGPFRPASYTWGGRPHRDAQAAQGLATLQADSNGMNGRQLVPAHFPKRVPLTKVILGVTVDPYPVVA